VKTKTVPIAPWYSNGEEWSQMQKILIVDDEKRITEVLEAYLVREGYEIHTADNGIDALKKAKSLNPDLMILDLMLPDISGEEV
jgi:DNA-binding response OmpR family regulator